VIALMAGMSPRFVMTFLWIFTDRLSIAFNSFFMGLAGFLLMPFTSVLYAMAYSPLTGVRGVGWLLVGFGVLLDFGAWGASGREARSRYPTAA
jgi:hypothetical protein